MAALSGHRSAFRFISPGMVCGSKLETLPKTKTTPAWEVVSKFSPSKYCLVHVRPAQAHPGALGKGEGIAEPACEHHGVE